jgi:hypothetical protein
LTPSLQAALAFNRLRLDSTVAAWVASDRGNPVPHHVWSEVLELRGFIRATGAADASALSEIEKAQRLASDSLRRVRYVLAEVRQRVKIADWAGAKRLADSVLRTWPSPHANSADALASLAALTGRANAYARYSRIGARTPKQGARDRASIERELAESAAELRAELLARGAIGDCSVGLAGLARRAREAQSAVTTDERTLFALLATPLRMAVPCTGLSIISALPPDVVPLSAAQHALLRGDTSAARRILGAHTGSSASAVSLDHAFGEAWLLLTMSDSTAAADYLRRVLAALPAAPRSILDQAHEAAAIPRLYALSAVLAAARGEAKTAKTNAEVVTTLWADADSSIQAAVNRVRLAGMLAERQRNGPGTLYP